MSALSRTAVLSILKIVATARRKFENSTNYIHSMEKKGSEPENDQKTMLLYLAVKGGNFFSSNEQLRGIIKPTESVRETEMSQFINTK
jgi:hypothetical protein